MSNIERHGETYHVTDEGEFKLACLIPERLPVASLPPRFAGEIGTLTKEQMIAALEDPQRKAARALYPQFILNQGRLGSCNAAATAGLMMRSREDQGLDFVELWYEAFYAAINGGRDVGSHLHDAFREMQTRGIPPLSACTGDRRIYQLHRVPASAWEQAKQFRALSDECFFIKKERELATALTLKMICNVAVHVDNSFSQMDADGVTRSRGGPGNHAVCVDDIRYSRTRGRFEYCIANSWGDRWGDSGRIWITWRQMEQCAGNHGFFALRSSASDITLPTIVA